MVAKFGKSAFQPPLHNVPETLSSLANNPTCTFTTLAFRCRPMSVSTKFVLNFRMRCSSIYVCHIAHELTSNILSWHQHPKHIIFSETSIGWVVLKKFNLWLLGWDDFARYHIPSVQNELILNYIPTILAGPAFVDRHLILLGAQFSLFLLGHFWLPFWRHFGTLLGAILASFGAMGFICVT